MYCLHLFVPLQSNKHTTVAVFTAVQINNMRKVPFIYLAVFAVLFAACNAPADKNASDTTKSTNINWHDSCEAAYQHMQAYYLAGQYDSMHAEAPAVMELCSKHAQWNIYYNAWERLAERLAWEQEYDRLAAEAEAMRTDAVKRDNEYGQAIAYYVLAQGYLVQDNFAEAARYYEQAVNHYPTSENPSMLNIIYNSYSQALLHIKEYDRMDELHKKWRQMLDRYPVDDDNPARDVYANWRVQYYFCTYLLQMERSQYNQAAATLDSAVYYEVIDGNIPANINLIMRYRCKLANVRGHYAEALTYADSTLRMSANIDDAAVIGALEDRTIALKGLGRYAEALADHEQLKQLNDSIIQTDNREQLNVLNKRFEVAELQLSEQRTRSQLYISMVVVVLLLVIVAFGIIYTRRVRQKNRKLYEQIMLLQKVNSQPVAEVTNPESNPLYTSICELMHQEKPYTDADFSREDLASRLATNRTYIADAIREGSGGLSFQQFLTAYRVSHATHLLAETDYSIEQIAFASGFNSRQVFARAFREQHGLSPSDFRQARHNL
ncbi:Helix-turn-helix domain-containing protein [Prevotellaceae bacterium HUN156]|nr:Helix-turn-helix domain-containing protein [Prevotellaceae bacterium HUN156]